jgi:hypothetical protein
MTEPTAKPECSYVEFKELSIVAAAHMHPAMQRGLTAVLALAKDAMQCTTAPLILGHAVMTPAIATTDRALKRAGMCREHRQKFLRGAIDAIFEDAIKMSDQRFDERGRELHPDGTVHDNYH